MDVINEQVFHRIFGTGVIIGQTDRMISVQFAGQEEPKDFLYPSAFSSFLRLGNSALQERVDGELRKIQEQREAEEKVHKEEQERIAREECEKRIAAKRVTKSKRSASSTKGAGSKG